MTNINKEEKALLDSIEKAEWQSVDNVNDSIASYAKIAQSTLSKEYNITLSVPENDFALLKRKSLDTGISTEMLVRSLIHNYTTGKLILNI